MSDKKFQFSSVRCEHARPGLVGPRSLLIPAEQVELSLSLSAALPDWGAGEHQHLSQAEYRPSYQRLIITPLV